VNWKHVLYKTPLDDDAFQNGGSPAWVESVFKRDAFVNATVVTVATPLHKACEYGNSPEMVEALLAAGADVKATIYNGITPLISLVRSNAPIASQVMIAQLLLATNCSVTQQMQDSNMVLDHACCISYDK